MRGRIARGSLVTAVTEAVPVADRPPCHHRRDHGRDHSRDGNSTQPHARAEGEEEEKRWAVDGTGAVTAVTAPNHARPARDRLEAPRRLVTALITAVMNPLGATTAKITAVKRSSPPSFFCSFFFLSSKASYT